jgi:hypothetical protein
MVAWTTLGSLLVPVYFYFGVAFGGGGHGWLAPLGGALTSFVTGPVTGLAWALRRTMTGWWIALCLMIFEVLVDVCLVRVTLPDENEVFKKAWEMGPVWVLAWSVLFLSHHLVALAIVLLGVEVEDAGHLGWGG